MTPLRTIAAGLLAGLFAALAAGCSEPRPWAHDGRGGLTWKDDVGPLFAARCVSCHGGSAPAAGYDLSQYEGVLGKGQGQTPAAIAGEPRSRIITAVDPAYADAIHKPVTDLAETVRKWVVDDRLAYLASPVHGGGLLNPADPEFHGQVLKDHDWDFGLCRRCHGDDFQGGAAQRSCFRCHEKGPTDCETCHGPKGLHGKSGAHATHLNGGALEKTLTCVECHTVPSAYSDVGHIRDANGKAITAPAQVTFGALASTPTADRAAPPSFDHASQTCSSVYCHGGAFTDSAATNASPRFDQPGTGQTKCGTCHGLPPSSHHIGSMACSTCHGLVVDAQRNIINPALHMDGKVELGDGSGTCSACHGSPGNPAPGPDLSGNTDPSAVTVGAHLQHLSGPHRLRGPLACRDCHPDVTEVDSPGHLAAPLPASVFPASEADGGLAFAFGSQPAWDRTAATCSNVYCHGGGQNLIGSRHLTPNWTAPELSVLQCGACHGIPPPDGVGGQDLGTPLTACSKCHPSTIDEHGTLLLDVEADGGVTSTHINGVVDVVP